MTSFNRSAEEKMAMDVDLTRTYRLKSPWYSNLVIVAGFYYL